MKDTEFRTRYGPWGLVAGASEGLGAEYTTQLAAKGLNLVLVARRANLLQGLAAQLAASWHIQTRVLALDLAQPQVPAVIASQTAELEIGLLVYNAALSVIGPFFARSLEDHQAELETNCRAPLALAHMLGKQMLARRRGGIILMSSVSALQGTALIANYTATKAYNLILAEGLWEELRQQGVDVVASCPGAVSTPGYLESTSRRPVPAATPAEVVAETLVALGREPSVMPSYSNKMTAFVMSRLMPRKMAIALMGRVMRRMYAH